MSGSFLLPEGLFLLRGRLDLLIFDFLFLLLMLAIRIADPYAFRSRARAVLSVGVAGGFRFWTRPGPATFYGRASAALRAPLYWTFRDYAQTTDIRMLDGRWRRVTMRAGEGIAKTATGVQALGCGMLRPC